MKIETDILHTKIDYSNANPNVTPLFQCSSFLSDSEYFYTRKENPNTTELELLFSKLEDCKQSICVTTGMTALYSALNLLQPGDHLIVNKLIYGCSYNLFKIFCKDKKIDLDFIDLGEITNLEQCLKSNTKMVLFESPTNPFLKSVNIKEISEVAKKFKEDILVVVDNTWATPLFQKPLKHGADITIYSATKFYSGHSDVMGGVISTDNSSLAEKLINSRFYSGTILSPFSAWLIRRSMQTFQLRMMHQQSVTKEIIKFLEGIDKIETIYYPEVDGNQMTGYGTLIFFEFTEKYKDCYEQFRNSLKLFEAGTSMACVVSATAQPYTGSHASMTDEDKKSVGIGESLVRLSFGLENIEDIKSDLLNAFNSLS